VHRARREFALRECEWKLGEQGRVSDNRVTTLTLDGVAFSWKLVMQHAATDHDEKA